MFSHTTRLLDMSRAVVIVRHNVLNVAGAQKRPTGQPCDDLLRLGQMQRATGVMRGAPRLAYLRYAAADGMTGNWCGVPEAFFVPGVK